MILEVLYVMWYGWVGDNFARTPREIVTPFYFLHPDPQHQLPALSVITIRYILQTLSEEDLGNKWADEPHKLDGDLKDFRAICASH